MFFANFIQGPMSLMSIYYPLDLDGQTSLNLIKIQLSLFQFKRAMICFHPMTLFTSIYAQHQATKLQQPHPDLTPGPASKY